MIIQTSNNNSYIAKLDLPTVLGASKMKDAQISAFVSNLHTQANQFDKKNLPCLRILKGLVELRQYSHVLADLAKIREIRKKILSQRPPILTLSTEMIQKILSTFSVKSLLSFKRISKRFNQIIDESFLFETTFMTPHAYCICRKVYRINEEKPPTYLKEVIRNLFAKAKWSSWEYQEFFHVCFKSIFIRDEMEKIKGTLSRTIDFIIVNLPPSLRCLPLYPIFESGDFQKLWMKAETIDKIIDKCENVKQVCIKDIEGCPKNLASLLQSKGVKKLEIDASDLYLLNCLVDSDIPTTFHTLKIIESSYIFENNEKLLWLKNCSNLVELELAIKKEFLPFCETVAAFNLLILKLNFINMSETTLSVQDLEVLFKYFPYATYFEGTIMPNNLSLNEIEALARQQISQSNRLGLEVKLQVYFRSGDGGCYGYIHLKRNDRVISNLTPDHFKFSP